MKTFEEYLRQTHAIYYSGTDNNMPDDFEQWFIPLDAETVLEYAEEWNKEQIHLAEQSLVGRVRSEIENTPSAVAPSAWTEALNGYRQVILSLPSLTPKPKGNEE